VGREQRKSPRKAVSTEAFIYTIDGWPVGSCGMLDASATGARLLLEADDAPADFILALSRDGKLRRRCHLVWQKDDQIGVSFQDA
jgi:hypothetical protein